MAEINGVNFSNAVKQAKEFLHGLDKDGSLTLEGTETSSVQYKVDAEEVDEQRDAFIAIKTQADAVKASNNPQEIKFFESAIKLIVTQLNNLGILKNTADRNLPLGVTYDEDVTKAKELLKTFIKSDGNIDLAKIEGQVDTEDVAEDRRSLYLAILQKADAIKTSSNPEEVTRLENAIKLVTERLNKAGFVRSLTATKDAPKRASK